MEVKECQYQNENQIKKPLKLFYYLITLTKFRVAILLFLHLDKRLRRCSNQTEPGSSHMTSPDDVAGLNSPTMFDSFEEIELHPLEHHRTLKSKRSRDGENTRVRSEDIR